MNKKMSIRRKADKIVLQNGEMCIKKKMKGTNEVGKNKQTKFVDFVPSALGGGGGGGGGE